MRNVDGHRQATTTGNMMAHCNIGMKLLIIIIGVDVSTSMSMLSHPMTFKAKLIHRRERDGDDDTNTGGHAQTIDDARIQISQTHAVDTVKDR